MKQCRGQAASERALEKRRSERAACGGSGAVFEAPALVAGLDDITMMGETVEQCGRHLRIAEDAWPFTECEIGRDDDRGSLVETADHVEQQLSAGLGEREIAEFVEDDKVEARQIIGEPALAASSTFSLEPVDKIDRGEEAATRSGADTTSCDRNCQMRLASACPPTRTTLRC